jgi:hypothetical protein
VTATTVEDEPAAVVERDRAGFFAAHPYVVLAAVVAVIATPLLVALGVLHSPRFYPLLDLAQTELRIRDVFTRHTPLIGLPGRFGTFPNQGSHPGPISFYALWPVYRLLGSSAFAMQCATASLHILTLTVSLWLARRRGGVPLVLAVGAIAVRLYASYGGAILTEAWNPYMPVTWWFLFLLAMWSVACRDYVVLPIAVVAATFCMQTHVPYLGLAGALLAIVTLGMIVLEWRARRAGTEADTDATTRWRALWKWIAVAVVLGAVLWVPPVVEQFTHDPGNLSVLSKDLRHPHEPVAGTKEGIRLFLHHLDPTDLFTNSDMTPDQRTVQGSLAPGMAFLALWGVSAVVAVWKRQRDAIALHAVVAGALFFELVSMSRIAGPTYFYLMLWAWGTTTLAGFAIVYTAWAVWRTGLDDERRGRVGRAGSAVLAGAIVVQAVLFSVDAAHTEVPNAPQTKTVGEVSRPTIAALSSGNVPGGGKSGRYLGTWNDPMTLGARGYALLLELERHGFHVGGNDINKVGVTLHRVIEPQDATAEVHLVSGSRAIAEWAASHRDDVRVAYFDPRNAAQQAEYRRLEQHVLSALRREGDAADARAIAQGNLAVALAEKFPPDLLPDARRLLALGLPLAVFVGPPAP